MMNESLPYYSAQVVRRYLDYPNSITVVREAMKALSADQVPQPLRTIVTVSAGKLFGVMPGALRSPREFGAKLVSAFPDPDAAGRTTHQGVVVLFERQHGDLLCVADAGEITKIRTAAASAVATEALARPEARRLTIFGCGSQAESHLLAIACVRRLDEVVVWGRSLARATQFAERMAKQTRLPVRAVADAQQAAECADIICTVTSSSTPVLRGEWVPPGAHVNVVGSGHAGPVEVDSALVVASRYIADSRRSALAAAAEFLVAKEAGLIGDEHIAAEIGEVLLGRVPGRTGADQITLYKSLGHVVQDLAAAAHVHDRSSGLPQ